MVMGIEEVILVADNKGIWDVKVEARLDTGAKRTSIDIVLAEFLRLKTFGEVTVNSTNGTQTRELVELTVIYDGDEYIVEASVSDRGHMNYPVVIGRDILEQE